MSASYVHPSSFVHESAEIGEGTRIWHFCHVMHTTRIGRDCSLGQNVFVAAEVTIGDNVKVQNNVSLYTGVVVESDVFLGPSMVFTNVVNPRSHISRKHEYRTTLVRKGATVGANATVVCGVTLGNYCFVGAGAVVTRDVPDYALVYGTPARIHGWMCHCGIQLSFPDGAEGTARCADCGAGYSRSGEAVTRLNGEA